MDGGKPKDADELLNNPLFKEALFAEMDKVMGWDKILDGDGTAKPLGLFIGVDKADGPDRSAVVTYEDLQKFKDKLR